MRLSLLILGACCLSAQTAKRPFHAQSPSTIKYSLEKVGNHDEETVEITNVTFDITEIPVPGHPPEERLILRKTNESKLVVGDIPEDGKITYEAWIAGTPLDQKPFYKFTVDGTEGERQNNQLLVIEHGADEIWWTVHSLGNGQHLFDTHATMLTMKPWGKIDQYRYVGLELAPDDAKDARLRDPHVVGVIIYATPEKVIREALLTCDDPKRAAELRSFADEDHTLSVAGTAGRTLKVSFRQRPPGLPNPADVLIPIVANDDLDLAHATLPLKLHVAAWKR